MKDELARWVRGLGARTIEVTTVVEDLPLKVPQARKQKTRLSACDLPPETIRLEIDGRPFHVVLRDEKVYMSYRTPSGTTSVKGVKSRGAKEVALELASHVRLSGSEWPDRSVALACNWPNNGSPRLTIAVLGDPADPEASPDFKPHNVVQTEIAMASLPGDAIEVTVANRVCYVLLEQNMVFMRVESWNGSSAYLREITTMARKKRLIAIAEEQVVSSGRARLFPHFG